jgi:hypothetical protein
MENEIFCASLLDSMRACEQMPGLSVLAHGEMVANYFNDLEAIVRRGEEPKYEWRLPEWVGDERLWSRLASRTILARYQLFHDAGKPFCRIVDEDGRQHFPDHARVSKEVWLSLGECPEVGELIGMDMDIHLLKDDGVAEFAKRPQASSLLLTGLSEIHANASMFGGIDSTSFKIKWKHINQRGKAILRAFG